MEGNASAQAGRRVAVVTGGSRGIGLEIGKQLASNGVAVVLAARDDKRGAEAAAALRELRLSDIVFHRLDVADPSSAACLAEFIRDKFGRLDILVNNAGILGAKFDFGDSTSPVLQKVVEEKSADETLEWLMQHTIESCVDAEECLRTNYHGAKNVIQALLPLLLASTDGRIVNVTSMFGQLSFFSGEELKRELDDVGKLSEERLDRLSVLFIEDFRDGALASRGWPASGGFLAYKTSKALVHAYSRFLARKHGGSPLRINCVHPGYVKTDMTCDTGDLTAEEGAAGPFALALLPEGGPTGAFFIRTELASFL